MKIATLYNILIKCFEENKINLTAVDMIIKSEGNINEDQSKRGKKPFVARIACFRIVDVFSPLLSASMEQKFFSSLTSPLYAIPHCYPLLDENRFTLNRDVHFVWKWGPRPRTSSRWYHSNKSAATFKKGIFMHPPWVPNCMQNFKGGWKFPFPKMFDA